MKCPHPWPKAVGAGLVLALAQACASAPPRSLSPTDEADARAQENPDPSSRGLQLTPQVGVSFAGRNNPDEPSGEEDNTAVVLGMKISRGSFSLRPELHWAEDSVQWTPSLSYDFPLLGGEGLGSLHGHVGVGYSMLDRRRNNVLGNTPSAFLRLGAEGHLAGQITAGAALMLAPWGYERDDLAIAGVTQVGIRF